MVFYEAGDEFCLDQGCSVQAHQMTEFQNKALILQGMYSLQKFCRKTLRLYSICCSVMKALKGTENTAIPRISSCLWTTEKKKKQHLSVDLYIQEMEQEKERYIYI